MIAYIDCYSGASGDMLLGALVDAGLSVPELQAALDKLGLPGLRITAQKVAKGPVQATQVNIDPGPEPQLSRHLPDIQNLIRQAGFSAQVTDHSLAIFQALGEAEAAIHGVSIEEIHFHEVGAADAIADIVGFAFGLEQIGITQLYASPLPLGTGSVKSSHGPLPLPAPATLALLAKAGAPTIPARENGIELVTPTGAAILATLATFRQPALVLQRIGYGAGRKEMPWPNVLRLWLGQQAEYPQPISSREEEGHHLVLETNIDDMNPQLYGALMERLFAAGALDVAYSPLQMKKNRPGTLVTVIARAADEAPLAQLLLRETTTLGVRAYTVRRWEAQRRMEQVETPYGQVPLKLKILEGQVIAATPEYDVCKSLADAVAVPVRDVIEAAIFAGQKRMEAQQREK
ncbi:MAG: nickel pincer cofactor biosynthesis protein LarC [Chloroflexi bacterium]|nr:nickel pincer cofactor biosynthesis protein LarC [Chloroflexota bacterium]